MSDSILLSDEFFALENECNEIMNGLNEDELRESFRSNSDKTTTWNSNFAQFYINSLELRRWTEYILSSSKKRNLKQLTRSESYLLQDYLSIAMKNECKLNHLRSLAMQLNNSDVRYSESNTTADKYTDAAEILRSGWVSTEMMEIEELWVNALHHLHGSSYQPNRDRLIKYIKLDIEESEAKLRSIDRRLQCLQTYPLNDIHGNSIDMKKAMNELKIEHFALKQTLHALNAARKLLHHIWSRPDESVRRLMIQSLSSELHSGSNAPGEFVAMCELLHRLERLMNVGHHIWIQHIELRELWRQNSPRTVQNKRIVEHLSETNSPVSTPSIGKESGIGTDSDHIHPYSAVHSPTSLRPMSCSPGASPCSQGDMRSSSRSRSTFCSVPVSESHNLRIAQSTASTHCTRARALSSDCITNYIATQHSDHPSMVTATPPTSMFCQETHYYTIENGSCASVTASTAQSLDCASSSTYFTCMNGTEGTPMKHTNRRAHSATTSSTSMAHYRQRTLPDMYTTPLPNKIGLTPTILPDFSSPIIPLMPQFASSPAITSVELDPILHRPADLCLDSNASFPLHSVDDAIIKEMDSLRRLPIDHFADSTFSELHPSSTELESTWPSANTPVSPQFFGSHYYPSDGPMTGLNGTTDHSYLGLGSFTFTLPSLNDQILEWDESGDLKDHSNGSLHPLSDTGRGPMDNRNSLHHSLPILNVQTDVLSMSERSDVQASLSATDTPSVFDSSPSRLKRRQCASKDELLVPGSSACPLSVEVAEQDLPKFNFRSSNDVLNFLQGVRRDAVPLMNLLNRLEQNSSNPPNETVSICEKFTDLEQERLQLDIDKSYIEYFTKQLHDWTEAADALNVTDKFSSVQDYTSTRHSVTLPADVSIELLAAVGTFTDWLVSVKARHCAAQWSLDRRALWLDHLTGLEHDVQETLPVIEQRVHMTIRNAKELIGMLRHGSVEPSFCTNLNASLSYRNPPPLLVQTVSKVPNNCDRNLLFRNLDDLRNLDETVTSVQTQLHSCRLLMNCSISKDDQYLNTELDVHRPISDDCVDGAQHYLDSPSFHLSEQSDDLSLKEPGNSRILESLINRVIVLKRHLKETVSQLEFAAIWTTSVSTDRSTDVQVDALSKDNFSRDKNWQLNDSFTDYRPVNQPMFPSVPDCEIDTSGSSISGYRSDSSNTNKLFMIGVCFFVFVSFCFGPSIFDLFPSDCSDRTNSSTIVELSSNRLLNRIMSLRRPNSKCIIW